MKMRHVSLIAVASAGVGALCWAAEPASPGAAPAGCCAAKVVCPMGAGKAVCAMGAVPAPAVPAHKYGLIDTRALQALMQAKVPAVVLDARAGKWDDGKRIPGAKALAPAATADEAAALIPAKEALVIVYCTNLKCPASAMLAEQLLGFGYTNILKYPDGIEGWISAGNAVETAK
jgi:rhodanese-related sulfurtransferase